MGTAVKKSVTACLVLMLAACSNPNLIQPTPSASALPVVAATVTQPPPAQPLGETHSAEPDPEWRGIPIMAGAIAGGGDEEGYVFTIRATLTQVQAYYQMELRNRGWQLSSEEAGSSSKTLLFMNGASETLTVSILSKGEETLVLLVR